MGAYDRERRREALRSHLLASLPYERVETTGEEAYRVWLQLKGERHGCPVVVGDDDDLLNVIHHWLNVAPQEPPEAILARAEPLEHPRDLARLNRDIREAPLGEWPVAQEPSQQPLTIAFDRHDQPLPKINILLIPAADSAEIPAFLRWGGVGLNPPAEHHVAALRAYRARYGAELVGITGSALNLQLHRRGPRTRDEAFALAEELSLYSPEMAGFYTLRMLASVLLVDTWWHLGWAGA